MIQLNGAEGGGQILRTALALSLLTGKAFYMTDVRATRPQPGLKPQHLTGVETAARMCANAVVEGAELKSREVRFVPGKFEPKNLTIDIGTAGSISLLLQSLLPALVVGKKKVVLEIVGGTDNIWAMPFDFMKNIFFPHLKRYADIDYELIKRGYYPKGGGKVKLSIKPKYTMETVSEAKPFDQLEQGELIQVKGKSHASTKLQEQQVADRQAKAAEMQLKSLNVPIRIETEYVDTFSPGSGITLWTQHALNVNEMDLDNPIVLGGDCIGERGKPSEDVGFEAAKDLLGAINSKAPIDHHLADNLVPFVAIFGGRIRYEKMTNHLRTNINTVHAFLGDVLELDEDNRIIKKLT